MDTNSGLFKMKKFAADAGTLFNRAVQVIITTSDFDMFSWSI